MDWEALPLFAGLDARVLRRVGQVAHRRRFQAGAAIFAEGAPCAGFHLLLDGFVRLYRINGGGRLHTLSLLRPPAAFNEVAAIDGRHNPFHATAVTAVEALVVGHKGLLNLLSDEPALMANYVQALASLNRDYIERLEEMTFRTIPSRLARLFLHEAGYSDQITPSQLTQEDIASVLGTTREVVGRALRELLNAGLLRKKGRQMYIADRAGLEQLAETNSMPRRLPEG